MSERKKPRGEDDDGGLAEAVESADDTGLISGEESITEAEIEHPELFEGG